MRLITDKQYEQMMEWARSLKVIGFPDEDSLAQQLVEAKRKRWTAEARLIEEKEKSRKKWFQMKRLLKSDDSKERLLEMMDMIEKCAEPNPCTHINSTDNPDFLDCPKCNPDVSKP